MIRKAPVTSMQKTYDECYLTCSTAIYFEGQNNEAEALRSWRTALDTIYYHNAYKIPSGYQPRTETERALQDSLRSMELQCKERVDLLEALKKSRQEAQEEAKSKSRESLSANGKAPLNAQGGSSLGDGTIAQANYSDLPRPSSSQPARSSPALPTRPAPQQPRPSYKSRKSSADEVARTRSMGDSMGPTLKPPAPLPEQPPRNARTPSPEKKGTMLRTLRSNPRDSSSSGRMTSKLRNSKPPAAAANAATKVWSGQQRPSIGNAEQATSSTNVNNSPQISQTTWDPQTRSLNVDRRPSATTEVEQSRRPSDNSFVRPPSPSDYLSPQPGRRSFETFTPSRQPPPYPEYPIMNPYSQRAFARSEESFETAKPPPPPPPHAAPTRPAEANTPRQRAPSPPSISKHKPPSLTYMKEYPDHPPNNPKKPTAGASAQSSSMPDAERAARGAAPPKTVQGKQAPSVPRKAVNTRALGVHAAMLHRQQLDNVQSNLQDRVSHDPDMADLRVPADGVDSASKKPIRRKAPARTASGQAVTPPTTDDSQDSGQEAEKGTEEADWERRCKRLLKNLPKGVDEASAKQIVNEIVIKGDEVHWDDVAGLEIAKSALKETVVYPFLRPDLFMGLREPARGMLLFGPPGTGKTMLARAVATESNSVFFAISASSLTSKFLGESEKLVRALFACAKALAPSIIFVDEIDSLLGSRGGSSEHEATRRIKTEFLVQWSDLQRAAAGRESTDGDATRVLVLAATNLPWAIDEAARRRFVRRQYIPLPEDHVRALQLKTLLSAQKHNLKDRDLKQLVRLTHNFSGSDITALAKDAAMGPLRSLGEKLLDMSPEDIRPISMQDFEASLINIRPSVSQQGLKEFEDWAKEFGERGG